MALKVEVDKIDDVAEPHRSLYVKGEDGRFRLDIDGMPDIAGLKNALNDERTQRKQLSDEVKKFKGVDLEWYGKVTQHKDAFDKYLATGGAPDPAALESEVSRRVERMKQDHQTAIETLSSKYASVEGRLSKVLVDQVITEAATTVGVIDTALPDVLSRARSIFRVVDGEVKPLTEKGDIIYGKDGVKPLTQQEWMAGLREAAPHLFKPSKGGGAGSGEGGGGGSTVRFKEDLTNSAEKAKYIGEHGMDAYLKLPNRQKAG